MGAMAQRPRVLVVDDEQAIVTRLAAILRVADGLDRSKRAAVDYTQG